MHPTGAKSVAATTAREIRKAIRQEKVAQIQKMQRDARPLKPTITCMPKPTLLKENAEATDQKNCTWCVMTKVRNEIPRFLDPRIICSCAVSIPAEKRLKDEDRRDIPIRPEIEPGYHETMEASEYHANYDHRHTEVFCEPLEAKMEREAYRELETPQTESSAQRPRVEIERQYFKSDVVLKVQASGMQGETVDHVLIVGPPKSGKTELQHHLRLRGVMILDTEDLPDANAKDTEVLLERTSVVTNRLDLMEDVRSKKILFITSTPEVLAARLPKVKVDVVQAWWRRAYEYAMQDQDTTIIETDKYVMSEWFILPDHHDLNQPWEQSIPRELEDI